MNPELYVRRRYINGTNSSNNNRELIFFISGIPANEQLLTMWQRRLLVIRCPLLHALLRSTQLLWSKTFYYEPLEMYSNEYYEFNAASAALDFTDDEEIRGRNELAKLGINIDKDWFVCVFARDTSYLDTIYTDKGDWSYHNYRNADIDSFNLAIEEIIARGGYVLRMGSHVNKPLKIVSPKVIDYALTCRDDFMDIFLPAKCRFFLGTTSGIADVAMIFDRPRIGVNWVPFGSAPWGKQNLFIPKLVSNTITGQMIPFSQLLRAFSNRSDRKIWDGNWALQEGYSHIDNTPEEILAITIEMLDRLDNNFVQTEEDKELQEVYRCLFPDDHWSIEVKTPISSHFLIIHRDLVVH